LKTTVNLSWHFLVVVVASTIQVPASQPSALKVKAAFRAAVHIFKAGDRELSPMQKQV
jgi:hypothetical protein